MKQKVRKAEDRNWWLVGVASLYTLIGLAVVIIAIINIPTFGWWSLALVLAGATPIAASVISIVKNDPSWILMDLILPG